MIKICFLLSVFAGVYLEADAAYSAPPPASYGPPETPAKYDFDWSVKDDYSGNDFGHQETRDGDRTDGSYTVLLPDGRKQTVTYYVDGDSGFVAEVTYEGEAQYPPQKPKGYGPPPAKPSSGYGVPKYS